MAPIRRYLRITKYSVLEVRIYLDDPAWAETWLLRRNDPALPRIIAAIRPDVLPKLREENERAKKGGKKGKKANAIRDKVVGDDFEVSLFYTNQSSPHSLLTKQKTFAPKPRLKSNSSKLTSWLGGDARIDPITLQDDAPSAVEPIVIREESDDEIRLEDILEIKQDVEDDIGGDDAISMDEGPTMELDSMTGVGQNVDDKKKLALRARYDGFSIYGKTLCLVIRRTGSGAVRNTAKSSALTSQKMMENWVSTQAQREEDGMIGIIDA